MQVIKPTKKEVFEQMKLEGCTWCGGYGSKSNNKNKYKTCLEQREQTDNHRE